MHTIQKLVWTAAELQEEHIILIPVKMRRRSLDKISVKRSVFFKLLLTATQKERVQDIIVVQKLISSNMGFIFFIFNVFILNYRAL